MKTALKKRLKNLSPSLFQTVQNVWWTGKPTMSLEEKVKYGTFPTKKGAPYGFGVYWAAREAKALGHPSVSVMEFGVAAGKGLLSLEAIAKEISLELDIDIKVYGFDLGEGLPKPIDYRDLPYVWQGGFYKMDVVALRSKLTKAELVLGNVKDTVTEFSKRTNVPPIGFMSIDLDYYSSTKDAFELLRTNNFDLYLPRPYVMLQDIISRDLEIHCEYVGELLAVKEFNDENSQRKICKLENLSLQRVRPATWNEKVYVCHMFDHPDYTKYIGASGEKEADELYQKRNRLNPDS